MSGGSSFGASDLAALEPPTTAHKTLGILNILFGTVLLLGGACCGVSALSQLAIAPAMEKLQAQQRDSLKQAAEKRKEQIAKLDEEAAAATNEAEKAAIEAQRDALQQKPEVVVPQFDYGSLYADPRVLGYAFTDIGTGLILNVLLLICGVGLLRSRAWARKAGVWVAGLKLVRLIAVYGFAIAVVAPLYSKKMADMAEQMVTQVPQQGTPAPPMREIGVAYSIMMTSSFALMIVFGAIYPAISLWVLTRSKVKRACGEPTASPTYY